MKFKDWSIDSLIEYLESCKSCGWFDFRKVQVVSGEIYIQNEEQAKTKAEMGEEE